MSDGKEVKRYIPDNTPIYLVGESTPEPTTCVVFGRDHDRIVAQHEKQFAEYCDRVGDDIQHLNKTIARQAREAEVSKAVIEKLRERIVEWVTQSHSDDEHMMNMCLMVEDRKYQEIAAIERAEGEKE